MTWRTSAALTLIAVAVLSCGRQPSPAPDVTVHLYQTRSDAPLGRIELQVRNADSRPITVTRATLTSPNLSESVAWTEPVEVLANAAVDLKVLVPKPVCDQPAQPSVVLETSVGRLALPAADDDRHFARLIAQACFEEAAAEVVRLAAPERLVVAGENRPVRFPITVTGPGPATIVEAHPTVMFSLVDDSGAVVDPLPLNVPVTGERRQIILHLIPGRCDAHVIAEDKQGTYLPLTLQVGTESGRVRVGASAEVRAQMYDYVARYCGLADN